MKHLNDYVLAFDLDGTALRSDGTMSQETLNVINKLKTVLIVSGRHFCEMQALLCKITVKDIIVVSCDGCYSHDRDGNVLLSSDLMRVKDFRIIKKLVRIKEAIIVTKSKDIFVANTFVSKIKSSLRMCKRFIICPNKRIIEKIRLCISDNLLDTYTILKNYYSVHLVSGKFLDIAAKHVNKYTMIHRVCSLKNINEDDIIYFGDDFNDLECFDNLKHSVAMGNAVPQIKAKAEYVTKSNDESGIVHALNCFYGLKI